MNWILRNGRYERLRQGANGPGFCEPGHALDQHVATGQKRDDEAFEQRSLPDNEFFHPIDQPDQSSAGGSDRFGALLGRTGEMRRNVERWIGKLERRFSLVHDDFSARRRSMSRRRMSPAASDVSLKDCFEALAGPPPLA